jgi:hypothetical protein
MHFTFAVMQMNGDITDRCRRAFRDVQRQEIAARVVQGFHLLLAEQLPAVVADVVRFRVEMDEALGLELDWQQADAVSALATFFFGGQPAVTCLLFSGYDAVHDATAVEAAEEVLAGWRSSMTMQAGPGVRSLRDRPLLVAILWPGPSDATRKRRLTIYAECLSIAFFQRAGRSANDPSRN